MKGGESDRETERERGTERRRQREKERERRRERDREGERERERKRETERKREKIILLVGRAINFERDPSKRSKEPIQKRMQRVLSAITLQGAIEKSPILLTQYWKFE